MVRCGTPPQAGIVATPLPPPPICQNRPWLASRFPIDAILLRTGNIRDQFAKLPEIAPKFHVLGRQISRGGAPNI